MSDRVAVYACTRNLYEQMYVCLKSLLINTKMDRVYLMIEDDEFPYPLPKNVYAYNVSGQELFKPGSPNFSNPWSYMTMLRCALGIIFEAEDKMLWLDCDTIVFEDISDLFDVNLDGYCIAAVREPDKSRGIFTYVNTGVLMSNLEVMRLLNKEPEMITFLNNFRFIWPDQDVINLLCQGRIRLVGSEYNCNGYTEPCIRPKILHYANVKNFKEDWAYKKYEQMDMPGLEEADDTDTVQLPTDE